MKTICVVDPNSNTLAYDYWFVRNIVLQKRYRVEFVCSSTTFNSEYIEKLIHLGVNVVVFKIKGQFFLTKVLNYIRMLFFLARRYPKYCVIHFQWSVARVIETPFFWVFRKKLFISFHNVLEHDSSKTKNYWASFLYTIAARSIFVSGYVKDFFFELHPHNTKHALVVEHPLCPLVNVEAAGVDKKKLGICFWGNVRPYKGLESLPTLARSTPGAPFLVAGQWSSSMEYLMPLFHRNKIKVVNRFLSEAELFNIISQFEIFVLPYKKATQSGVFYTLLAHRKVVLATKVGDTYRKMVSWGLGNLCFDFNDASSFKSAYEYAIHNTDEIRTRVERACKLHEEEVLRSTREYLSAIDALSFDKSR